MHKSTVYRVLKRWIEEGEQGLEDKPALLKLRLSCHHQRMTFIRVVPLRL
jgi:transposase